MGGGTSPFSRPEDSEGPGGYPNLKIGRLDVLSEDSAPARRRRQAVEASTASFPAKLNFITIEFYPWNAMPLRVWFDGLGVK